MSRWTHIAGARVPQGYEFIELCNGAYDAAEDTLYVVDRGIQLDGNRCIWVIRVETGEIRAAIPLIGLTVVPGHSRGRNSGIIIDSNSSSFTFVIPGTTTNVNDTWIRFTWNPSTTSFDFITAPFDTGGVGQFGLFNISGTDYLMGTRLEDAGEFPNNKFLRRFDLPGLGFVDQFDLGDSGPCALAYDPTRELFLIGFNGPTPFAYQLGIGAFQLFANPPGSTQWFYATYLTSSNRFALCGLSTVMRFMTWNGVNYTEAAPLNVFNQDPNGTEIWASVMGGQKIFCAGNDLANVPIMTTVDVATMTKAPYIQVDYQNGFIEMPNTFLVSSITNDRLQIFTALTTQFVREIFSP